MSFDIYYAVLRKGKIMSTLERTHVDEWVPQFFNLIPPSKEGRVISKAWSADAVIQKGDWPIRRRRHTADERKETKEHEAEVTKS